MSFFTFSRLKRNRFSNWLWGVDKITLSLILVITFIGAFLVFSASPAVARKVGFSDEYHYIKRQIIFIFISLGVVFTLSMARLKTIRRIAIFGYFLTLVLMMIALFSGETKGASRWIKFLGFSLQPSEFIKPTFIVVSAWLLDGSKKYDEFPGAFFSTCLFGITAVALLLQPDVGMTLVVSAVWFFQLFLAGLPLMLVGILAIGGLAAVLGAYFMFDHVHERVNNFLAADKGLPYQVEHSLLSFKNGNLLGLGPGEGIEKMILPDAHTDFIFAVAGEEFGVWLCLLLVILFCVIVIRCLALSLKDKNLFIIYAAAGLAASFGLQSIINMFSTLNLMPTKGMTLPFISYGGSSLLASALGMGMLLALTRKNLTAIEKDNM